VGELLGRRVAGLGFLVEEGRYRDRGEDADDQDHDQQLDQREAAFASARLFGGLHEKRIGPTCARL
jgi:hypothetical protein